MNIKAHWQAIYNEMRDALDGAGHTGVPIYHVSSVDTQTGAPANAPFVIYRQDVERSYGTYGGGELKVARSGWVITSYARDLEDGLAYIGAIVGAITEGIENTSDSYVTTSVEVIGVQSIYEDDFKVYATHLRVLWERSL